MMKRITFRVLGLVFLIFRIFPVQNSKAVLLRHFNARGSLEELGDALDRGGRYRAVRLNSWKSPLAFYHMATAKVIFLNNNLNLLPFLRFSKKTRLVQIWHGDGILKRWGFSLPENQGQRVIQYDAVVCCSQAARPYWAQAFGLPAERVLPLGSARADAITRPCDLPALRAAFDLKYPQCRGKRLVLYAPTFREGAAQPLSRFDFAAFRERFGGEAVLLVRAHPAIRGTYDLSGTGAVDVGGEPNPMDLLRVSDCLVTDYSSLMLDAAAFGLPVFIYAYDYDAYMSGERGFYRDLKELPPGPIVTEFSELLDALDMPDGHAAQRAAFVKFHLGEIDGKACERIIAAFLG